MTNPQEPRTGNGRANAIGWGLAAGLLVVILVIVFLIFASRGEPRRETKIEVDIPRTTTQVEKPTVEVDVPEKIEIEVKTPPPQKKTGTQ